MIVTQSSDIWNILGYLQMEKKKICICQRPSFSKMDQPWPKTYKLKLSTLPSKLTKWLENDVIIPSNDSALLAFWDIPLPDRPKVHKQYWDKIDMNYNVDIIQNLQIQNFINVNEERNTFSFKASYTVWSESSTKIHQKLSIAICCANSRHSCT